MLSRYRIHFVGLLALAVLVHYWRAGELTDGSFVILAVFSAIELGIWAFFQYQFAAHRDDPIRLQWVGRKHDLWSRSSQKGTKPVTRRSAA